MSHIKEGGIFKPSKNWPYGLKDQEMEMTLGKRIAHLRRLQNMKQDDLAQQLNISPQPSANGKMIKAVLTSAPCRFYPRYLMLASMSF